MECEKFKVFLLEELNLNINFYMRADAFRDLSSHHPSLKGRILDSLPHYSGHGALLGRLSNEVMQEYSSQLKNLFSLPNIG